MKYNINILNYENFWKDYLDGKLNEEGEAFLFDFLENNPELFDMLDEDKTVKLEAPHLIFPRKKDILAENQTDNLLISKIEDVISEENDKFISEKINSDEKIKRDFERYKNTKLKSDETIVFPDKNKLKKSRTIPVYTYITAVAAVFLIVYVAGTFIFNQGNIINVERVQYSEFEVKHRQSTEDLQEKIKGDLYRDQIKSVQKVDDSTDRIRSQYQDKGHELFYLERRPISQISAQAIDIDIENKFAAVKYRELIAVAIPQEPVINYTVEFIPSGRDNRLISSINQIFDFGREINISESIKDLRERRSELLLSSINN